MLRDELKASMQDAMRAKEKHKLSTIRLVLAAIKDRDIAARTEDQTEADDDKVITEILSKMIKQRRDSIVAYEEGGRCELAERERSEIDIIQGFLPQQLSEAEMQSASEQAVTDLGAEGIKDMGRVMGHLKSAFAGQMDFAKAAGIVRGLLT